MRGLEERAGKSMPKLKNRRYWFSLSLSLSIYILQKKYGNLDPERKGLSLYVGFLLPCSHVV